jgi:hypothetical protein
MGVDYLLAVGANRACVREESGVPVLFGGRLEERVESNHVTLLLKSFVRVEKLVRTSFELKAR